MSIQTSTIELVKVEVPKQEQVKPIQWGDGRYSGVMRELYSDSIRLLGLGKTQAEKLARSFGAELGRFNAQSKISFGRQTKDGKMTLRESATMKGITVTYPVSMAKLCVQLQDAMQNGIEKFDSVTLRPDFLEWLNK